MEKEVVDEEKGEDQEEKLRSNEKERRGEKHTSPVYLRVAHREQLLKESSILSNYSNDYARFSTILKEKLPPSIKFHGTKIPNHHVRNCRWGCHEVVQCYRPTKGNELLGSMQRVLTSIFIQYRPPDHS